jgi:hypothetical protein
MTHAQNSVRVRLAAFVFVAASMLPAHSRADMPNAASLVDYGFKGFSLGLELGLSVGYISTGPVYRTEEWRKLVLGMGVGALIGMSTGIIVAVVDVTNHDVPVGYYVLRDAGYGTVLGATMGAVVGLLLWVDQGTPKDVLKGAAFGTLFGALAGIVYGAIEAKNAAAPTGIRFGADWRLSLAPIGTQRAPGVAAVLSGRF